MLDSRNNNRIMSQQIKSNNRYILIRRSFAHLNSKLSRLLYVTFNRPLLEFSVPFWSPALKSDLYLLERVQHRSSRLMQSLGKLNYDEHLTVLELNTMSENNLWTKTKRRYNQIFHDIDKMEIDINCSFQENHCFKYNREISRHTHWANFIFNQSANLWNSLPTQLVKTKKVNGFKAGFGYWMSSNQAAIVCWKLTGLNQLHQITITSY